MIKKIAAAPLKNKQDASTSRSHKPDTLVLSRPDTRVSKKRLSTAIPHFIIRHFLFDILRFGF